MNQTRKSKQAETSAGVDSSLSFTTAEVRRRIFIVSPAGEVGVAMAGAVRTASRSERRENRRPKGARS